MIPAVTPAEPFSGRSYPVWQGRPTLVVVVDTEEEFDWGAPLSRGATTVTAMRHIGRVQRLCGRAGVVPTYVIDYPVATQPEGYEALAAWARDGACRIGAHLHPWVNPPHDEAVSGPNSFTSNLPPPLQAAKMRELCAAVEAHTGVTPRVFKAGRYGIGPHMTGMFDELGLTVDASINPCISFASESGPDFSAFDSRPFWIDRPHGNLEVPCTQGFVGWARRHGLPLRQAAERWRAVRAPGILARAGAVDRVMLSPEGNTLAEMIALTRHLFADGLRVFSLTFHSPSVEPGHTPYVRSAADLDTFLSRIAGYFEFFFGDLDGLASTPERVHQDLIGAPVGPA